MDTPLDSNALSATEREIIRIAIPRHTLRPKSPPLYPIYASDELNVILRFLAAYLTEFEETLARERELAKGCENVKTFAGRVKYREHQVATVKELVKRAYWPQKHLALIPQDEIDRRLGRCVQQSTTISEQKQ